MFFEDIIIIEKFDFTNPRKFFVVGSSVIQIYMVTRKQYLYNLQFAAVIIADFS